MPNRRILALDDDSNFLELYRFILEPDGFEVELASTPEEAVSRVQTALKSRLPFAGAFIDLHLAEGKTGLDVIRRLRELDPQLHFVAVTDSGDEMLEKLEKFFRPEEAGVWDFLSKPFAEGEILHKARRMVLQTELEESVACNRQPSSLTPTSKKAKR